MNHEQTAPSAPFVSCSTVIAGPPVFSCTMSPAEMCSSAIASSLCEAYPATRTLQHHRSEAAIAELVLLKPLTAQRSVGILLVDRHHRASRLQLNDVANRKAFSCHTRPPYPLDRWG